MLILYPFTYGNKSITALQEYYFYFWVSLFLPSLKVSMCLLGNKTDPLKCSGFFSQEKKVSQDSVTELTNNYCPSKYNCQITDIRELKSRPLRFPSWELISAERTLDLIWYSFIQIHLHERNEEERQKKEKRESKTPSDFLLLCQEFFSFLVTFFVFI